MAVCCLGFAAPARAQDSLFDTQAPLVLELATDLRALLRDRGTERDEHRATLRYRGADGDTGSLAIEVRTRGIYRLKHCPFPPLRLDFPKGKVKSTPFAGQDKLKLVTHCDSRSPYEQNLLQEFAAYRVFNAITDRSFRARLARVTYVDTARADSVTRFGFLIESEEELARRLDTGIIAADNVHDLLIDPPSMTVVSVFEYLIGNTDWSVWQRHNIVLLRGAGDTLFAVPYDFDFSGLVNAPYATTPPQLPIRNVRDRLYRGFCQPDSVVNAALEQFRGARDSVYANLRAITGLERRHLDDMVRYVDEFYRILDDPTATRREFVRACRQLP